MATTPSTPVKTKKLSFPHPIPCPHPTLEPPASAYDCMVKITVGKGDSQKTFHMYRGLLCFHSAYFKNLFKGGFKEAQSDTHMIPETAVQIFELFYTWVCTGTIDRSDGTCDSEIDHSTITSLYAFADYIMAEELKNRAVELFLIRTYEAWECFLLGTQDLYDRTAEGCSLRRLHVDILLTIFDFPDFRQSVKDLPTDFIADLFESSKAKDLVFGRPRYLTRELWCMGMREIFCKNYHEHTKTSDLCSTRPASKRQKIKSGSKITKEEPGASQ